MEGDHGINETTQKVASVANKFKPLDLLLVVGGDSLN